MLHAKDSSSRLRKAAIALTASAIVIASAFSVAAQEVKSATFNGAPACASITDPAEGGKCEIRESFRRTEEARRRGTAADAKGAAADARGAAAASATKCLDRLLGEISAAKAKAPLTPDQKTLFKARMEACDKA